MSEKTSFLKMNDTCPRRDSAEDAKIASKVSMVSIVGNIVLALLKLLAGIVAHSTAMVSDAIHSASDVVSSIIVIIGVKMSAKDSDSDHPYGHERFECVAAIILSMMLALTGVGIGYEAYQLIRAGASTSVMPGLIALIAAIVSIVCKEAMYWYTRKYAIEIDSTALMADAWHHRSDALSSIGAFLGILGARMGVPYSDQLASIIICVFIIKSAYDIFKEAIDKMVDHACDEETQAAMRKAAMSIEGVIDVDLLQTRVFGNKIYVDLEIQADRNLRLYEAHEVAEAVHDKIELDFPKVKHIMVHVNPSEE